MPYIPLSLQREAPRLHIRKIMKKIHIALLLWIFLFCACSPDKQIESLFRQTDLLLIEQPDSALRLLQTLPKNQKLSSKENARYALLLAQAMNKCEKPLLPCDSLLNTALDYYDSDEKERAVALLYKGRLEAEMGQNERAIGYFQEGMEIIKAFPKETEIKKRILSSLGNEYFDAQLYEESKKAYKEFYKYCTTDKDKSVALINLGSYYCMTNKEDSAIIIQRTALKHAKAAKDSTQIAIVQQGLSVSFSLLGKIDSAIHYAKSAIHQLLNKEENGVYYSHLGNLLSDNNETDSASYYLKKALKDTIHAGGENCLISLSDIEQKNGNYQTAIMYLEEYIARMDSLYNTEGSLKVQKLIYEYDTKIQLKREQERELRTRRYITGGGIIICLIIVILYQKYIHRKKEEALYHQHSLAEAQNKIASLQITIKDNQEMLQLMQQEYKHSQQKQEKILEQIVQKGNLIEQLKKEKNELRKHFFSQSNIYKKIIALSTQETTNKKAMKVLTISEQETLKKEVNCIYTDYATYLKTEYPKLTEDDIFCLCLQEAQLSPQAIAISLGYSDTHPLNQRKSRIRKRMEEGETSKCD